MLLGGALKREAELEYEQQWEGDQSYGVNVNVNVVFLLKRYISIVKHSLVKMLYRHYYWVSLMFVLIFDDQCSANGFLALIKMHSTIVRLSNRAFMTF